MRVLVCGGGNMGHGIAGMLATRGNNVHVLTRNPGKWHDHLNINYMGKDLVGMICGVTSDVPDCKFDAVIVTCPLTAAPHILGKLKALPVECGIICIPGRLFCNYLDKAGLSRHPTVLVSRVPYICRTQTYGVSVHISGTAHESLKYATRNGASGDIIYSLFGMDTQPLANRMSIDLSNSNSLLHPARMMDMCPSAHKGVKFYAEWTDRASDLLIRADDELQAIIRRINHDADSRVEVIPILTHYGCTDAKSLTKKITSIASLTGIESPVNDDGTLDRTHRYYTEDVLIGLHSVLQTGIHTGVETPTILHMYCTLTLDI